VRGGLTALAGLLVLGACAPTVTSPDLGAPRIVCPAYLTAPVEQEPVAPALTPEQRLALDTASVRAVGTDLTAQTALAGVQTQGWGRRGWSRVEAAAEWCATLDKATLIVPDD
jgi:hypothetical protein